MQRQGELKWTEGLFLTWLELSPYTEPWDSSMSPTWSRGGPTQAGVSRLAHSGPSKGRQQPVLKAGAIHPLNQGVPAVRAQWSNWRTGSCLSSGSSFPCDWNSPSGQGPPCLSVALSEV